MPLVCPRHYTKAEVRRIRSLNISAEVAAGKPLSQAVAIALSQERRCKERHRTRTRR